jgi:prepilin-type N-terminal cleavage/methylation domain-containing protein
MFYFNSKKSKGFTVIELMISIFILSIAIIGAFNAFTTMDILTSSSTDRFTAAYLAQEAVEVVKNIRDTNWLRMESDSSVAWSTGLSDINTDCTAGCELDYKTFGVTGSLLYPWTERYLYIDSNGFYVYESTDNKITKFKRKVTITPIESSEGVYDILKVVVQVYWDEKANMLHPDKSEDSIIVEEYLYNWY